MTMNAAVRYALKKLAWWSVACLGLLLLQSSLEPGPAAQRVPLPAESVVKDADLFAHESILPSPDGKWVTYIAGDPSKPMQFDFEGQRYTKSGYAMLAGALAQSVWVSEVSTGTSLEIASAQGSSWNPNWSPDSRHLAFYSDRGGRAALWIWDRQTKTTKQVSPIEIHTSWWRERPVWSADGKTVLCKVLPEGMTLEDVLKLAPGYMGGEPKPAHVDLKTPSVHVYSNHPGENQPKAAAAVVASAATKSDELEGVTYFDSAYLSDLARIDISTGAVTRLVRRIRPMSYAYSPDGTNIAILNMDGIVPHTQQVAYSIAVYGVREQTTRTVARGIFDVNNLTTRMSWSPDGTRFAYSDTGKTAERACYVVNLKSGERVKLSSEIPATSMNFSWGPPLWDKKGKWIYLLDSSSGRLWEVAADGKRTREVVKLPGLAIHDVAVAEEAGTYWSPDDGQTMYIRVHDDISKKDALYSVRVQTGESAKLYDGDEAIGLGAMGAFIGVSQGSGALIYSSQSAVHPSDVWALDLSTRQPKQLSSLNPQYASASMGHVRIIEWISLLGERLHGTLLLPGDYHEGERYPLIVWVYGGEMGSESGNRFAFGWGSAFNPQMWASRGYAVLYPDVPLHPGTPVDDLVSAVITGVNKTVELGIVDPERLAVMGQSFGGYNVVALLTRTSIFKAAIAMSAAPTDLFQGYTCFEGGVAACVGYYEEGQGGMKGSPWEFKERYFANSPFFWLDRVKTPLLIERGKLDEISAANGNIFNALRSLNKDVEFLEYDHEEHVLQQPVNVIDFWNRRIAWVDKHLKSAPAQKASSAPVPSSER
ncbi:MAG: prolyl oligopeptidase family serine peptidase [Candidatus Acidiferrales bacterium]